MKNIQKTVFKAMTCLLLSSTLAFAGSDIKGAVINTSNTKNKVNVAVGSNSTANLDSVNIKNSSVTGAVVNTPAGQTSANVAVGSGNKANLSSVNMESSSVKGAVINT
ncbi:MAG: hypothetical protein Q8M56_18845, partial [Desulfobacterales bacterium]|nr:hypothetical protein [Desulfobacterales bacterium]